MLVVSDYSQLQARMFNELYDPRATWATISDAHKRELALTLDQVHAYLSYIRPELVLFPMRGAGPLLYGLSVLNRVYQTLGMPSSVVDYDVLALPIGTTVTSDDLLSQKGIVRRVAPERLARLQADAVKQGVGQKIYSHGANLLKYLILTKHLTEYQRHHHRPLRNVALVDEVQNGGTSSTAIRLLQDCLQRIAPTQPPITLHLIGIQDARAIGRKRPPDRPAKAYIEIAEANTTNAAQIRFVQFVTCLFTVDVPNLLPLIVYEDNPVMADSFTVVDNPIMAELLETYIFDLFSLHP